MKFLIPMVSGLNLILLALPALGGPPPAPAEDRVELLWPSGAPGALGTEDTDKPTLTIFLPPKGRATGNGVVVCPGGGYRLVVSEKEGKPMAEWLNSMGIAAFVLRYRIGPRYQHPAPMLDVQRAIRTVRHRAKEFGISPDSIGA